MVLERDSSSSAPRWRGAVGGALALALAALAAHAGRLSETPAGAAVPGLAALGPASIGRLRAVPLNSAGQIPQGLEALGREALAHAPLSYEPFFAAAAGGFRRPADAGSEGDAALLREALRRNPRSRETRTFLLRHAVATGDLGGAIDQIAALNRLTASTEGLMLGVGRAINSPRLVDEAAAALKPHPELFNAFLRGFTGAAKSREITVRMITRLPAEAMDEPEVRRLAIRELVRVSAFAEARQLWGSKIQSQGLIHSGDFSDVSSPPPFNWDLVANATGAAERGKRGGVSVDYFGREPGPLVSQLVTLPAGRYAAKIVYRTEGGTPGAIGLQVRCAGQQTKILDQPLNAAIGASQALSTTFTVPAAECLGQVISVSGRIRETREPQQALIRNIEIQRSTP